MDPNWLAWAKQLQSIAQAGLAFTPDPYDEERYQQLVRIATEMLAHGAGVAPSRAGEVFVPAKRYPTPTVDVRGALFRDDAILLVREASDGLWTLPGGWADVCETAAENVIREIREEAGFDSRVVKLIGLFDRGRRGHRPALPIHVYKVFFLCEIVGGEERTSLETTEVGFFRQEVLPPLSLARVTSEEVERAFAHHRDHSLPAEFD
jgi:ADP-ribose pyrophosphatase YjhB (NUDIX family)